MRIDDPQLVGEITNALDQKIAGRVLLETQVANNDGDITLTLPATPYNRFEVEIDDIASSINDRILICRIGTNGAIRSLASDYEFTCRYETSDGADEHRDRNADHIAMASNAGNLRFGDYVDVAPNEDRIPMNTGSYHVLLTPGNGTNSTPKVSFRGEYFSSEGINDRRLVHANGSGLYKGWTSLNYGRADEIQFLFDSNTINRGTFRLYGTE
jgi:hypothetical protein